MKTIKMMKLNRFEGAINMKLDIGLNIQLEKQPEREGEEVVLYKSRVVDIQSKDAVLIDYPINLTTGCQ